MFRCLLRPLIQYSTRFSRQVHGGNNIFYGKLIAERILAKCQNECSEFVENYRRRPQLVAILVGGNEASKLYVRNKQRLAERVGGLNLKFQFSLIFCFEIL